ncbi:MAG: phosphomethylpyrimidine synthase ThiC [Candidatus Tantalella remota]|nr:phosphomethylpyrimidine synthase ThiC [Candidatus Tantalella remota]
MINVKESVLKSAVKLEDAPLCELKKGLRDGTLVVPNNNNHDIPRPCAVGKGMKTKVNANFGLSPDASNMDFEMKKMDMAVSAGADAVMDLSTGPLLGKMRKKVLAECPVPLGTVPVYELACMKEKDFLSMREDDFIDVLWKQAEEGVDFFTIHSGINLEATKLIRQKPRIMNVVSRGGALLSSWMMKTGRENPFLSRFDDVIKIAREYNITLSLGDSLRPGAISDATDRLQIQELLVLGGQQQEALAGGVQVMIEGPGHVPLDQIEANVRLQKSVCHGAPFYVLGPLVTDSAPGYDHIVGAIGGAIAAWHGADFLCYVTPAEHLRLPDVEDVRQGVMASKIAAHAADIVKGIPSAIQRDIEMSKARAKRDWDTQFKLSLDPDLPGKKRDGAPPKEEDVCSMCSEYCSIKITEESIEAGNKS